MKIKFYCIPNACGLKFDTNPEREQFFNGLRPGVQAAAERVAMRSIRFHPSKLRDPGFEIQLVTADGLSEQQSVKIQQAPPLPPAPVAPKDFVTTSPFAGSVGPNATRPLPGIVPPPPPEMLAVNQPAQPSPAPSQEPAPIPQVEKKEAAIPPPATQDDPEPPDRRTRAWKEWKARQTK